MSINQVMFEVEERTVTLRVEEWVTLLSVVELHAGRQCMPVDPGTADSVATRLTRQLVGKPFPLEET